MSFSLFIDLYISPGLDPRLFNDVRNIVMIDRSVRERCLEIKVVFFANPIQFKNANIANLILALPLKMN